jgi:hypothetical protein
MKYLKTYNESIRNLMTPKSEEEILKSLKGLDNSELLRKSINNEFIKGVELALQNELKYDDIHLIIYKIFSIKNKEFIRLLLGKVKNKLSEDQIYIIEKYQLGLHQDEEKEYEIWFKEQLTDLEISRSIKNPDLIIYKKNDKVLYNYDKKNGWFDINYNEIWSVFESKYHLKYDEISLLTKGMVEEHLNLKGITTFLPCHDDVTMVEEHLNLKGITTGWLDIALDIMVEEHLNLKGITTLNPYLQVI